MSIPYHVLDGKHIALHLQVLKEKSKKNLEGSDLHSSSLGSTIDSKKTNENSIKKTNFDSSKFLKNQFEINQKNSQKSIIPQQVYNEKDYIYQKNEIEDWEYIMPEYDSQNLISADINFKTNEEKKYYNFIEDNKISYPQNYESINNHGSLNDNYQFANMKNSDEQ